MKRESKKKINEILEPELNAKLDIVVLPWASASQQLQLMLSGDEKIDLLYTSATTAVQYMHSGQIMDMSELIDKYGTNLKDIYGEDIAKTNQIDGFVYGVPKPDRTRQHSSHLHEKRPGRKV